MKVAVSVSGLILLGLMLAAQSSAAELNGTDVAAQTPGLVKPKPELKGIDKKKFKFDQNGNVKNNFKILGENLDRLKLSKTKVTVKDKHKKATWTIDNATLKIHEGGKWIMVKKPKIKKNRTAMATTPGDLTITVTSNLPLEPLQASVTYYD